MAGKDNLIGKGFESRPENINRKGQPKKFRLSTALEEVLENDGRMVIYDVYEVDKDTKKETGNMFEAARVSIPNAKALILAASRKALKGDVKAISLLWDRSEGKPIQPILHKEVNRKEVDLSRLTTEEKDTWYELLEKVRIKDYERF